MAALVAIVTAGIATYAIVANANSDSRKIQSLVDKFAVAVDNQDQAAIVSMLCAAEAANITDADGYGSAEDGGVTKANTNPTPVKTTDIRVTGDTATAKVSRPPRAPITLSFKRENGAWKVCDPGSDSATPGPTTS